MPIYYLAITLRCAKRRSTSIGSACMKQFYNTPHPEVVDHCRICSWSTVPSVLLENNLSSMQLLWQPVRQVGLLLSDSGTNCLHVQKHIRAYFFTAAFNFAYWSLAFANKILYSLCDTCFDFL